MMADSSLFVAQWRKERGAAEFLALHERSIVVPHIVIAELLSGAAVSQNPKRETARVESLWTLFPTCWPDRATVESFARVRAEVTRAGTPIGQHDLWIAAMAMQYDMPVASSDDDFKKIRGLKTACWR